MIRDLPSLEKAVDDLEKELIALKNVQRIGVSSLKSYKTASSAAYDWAHYIDVPTRRFRLTFTFATAKKGAIMRLAAFYRINDGNVMAAPVPNNPPTAPSLQLEIVPEQLYDDRMTWQVFLFNNTFNGAYPEGLTAYAKFFFDGTDAGTWSIVQL